MTVELLLIVIIGGITLLGFLIAINAHGPFRLSVSYFLATLMLAGTVWIIVQYVNKDIELKKTEELSKLERNRIAELENYKQRAEDIARKNKTYVEITKQFVAIVSNASNYALMMQNVNLQNKNLDFETLVRKASDSKNKVDELSAQFSKMDSIKIIYPDSYELISDGIKSLTEAAISYKNYYYSEDSTEEGKREKSMRLRAKDALDKFSKASSLIK